MPDSRGEWTAQEIDGFMTAVLLHPKNIHRKLIGIAVAREDDGRTVVQTDANRVDRLTLTRHASAGDFVWADEVIA